MNCSKCNDVGFWFQQFKDCAGTYTIYCTSCDADPDDEPCRDILIKL